MLKETKRNSTPDNSMHPRTAQAILFDLLCEQPGFEVIATDTTARATLKKRLQRGRKFEILVQIFGQNILRAVPESSHSYKETKLRRFQALQSLCRSGLHNLPLLFELEMFPCRLHLGQMAY